MTVTAGPLDGVRVLDLTRVLAGPLSTMMLGDMGADVVKIERPGRGDDTRAWGPPFVEGESAYYLGVNRNKRSVALDTATDDGKAALGRLIREADIVIDNYKHGTLARWGFDDAWFAREAPRAIRCSITGYGASGPDAARPGYDFILQAESGLMSICGEKDGSPMKYGVAIVDICTGMLACNAILAALHARSETGKGQQIDISLFESSLFMLANVASNYLIGGGRGARYGNGHPNIVPYTVYDAKDAAIAVAVGNDAQFARFAELLGHAEWASDARFATNKDRVNNRDTIDGLINEALSADSADNWIAKLLADGIPCGRINSVAEALDTDQAKARDMVATVEHPTAGLLRLLGAPFKFSGTPTSIRRPPPLLGEHTEEVLAHGFGAPGTRKSGAA
jgi:crotonobetainyl-CoA:carnitine CoA-transferase CaiB-like acyl-CoA transferase